MKRLIATLLSLSFIVGCDKFKLDDVKYSGSSMDSPAVTVDSGKKRVKNYANNDVVKSQPKIVIRNSTIAINKKIVWLGDDLNKWKSALGGKPRCIAEKASVTICVWDDFGIEVGTDSVQLDKAKFLKMTFAFAETVEGFPRSNYSPTQPFNGHLELDGFPITSATEFREIRRHADEKRDVRCGGRDCGNPSGGFSDGASLYMQLDSHNDRGRLLGFSVTCSSTKDCADLIPK